METPYRYVHIEGSSEVAVDELETGTVMVHFDQSYNTMGSTDRKPAFVFVSREQAVELMTQLSEIL